MEHTHLVSDVQRLIEILGQLPEPVVEPAFVVVSGLPGTGKTYFCSKLAERLPFVVLESDALRKTLFPSPGYGSSESSYLFWVCHLLIERLLKKGIPVIMDAINLSERYRERLCNIAEHLNARPILVRVEVPPEGAHERLKARQASRGEGSKSDAGWEAYQRMASIVQKIRRNHYAVDTSRDITSVLGKVVRGVRR